jgi:hypothetical protein
MKASKWVLGLGLTAGMLLSAVEAKAVFNPPQGNLHFKLTDASNVYRDLDDDGTLDPVPRGNLQNQAGVPLVGDEDFTAFRLTSFNVGNDNTLISFPQQGQNLVGVVTFLEIGNTDGPEPFGGNTVFNAGIVGSDRPYQAGPAGTIGRFFLFSTDDPNAGDFDFAGANTPDQVDFSTGLNDNLVSDGVNSFTVDHLNGFTRGAGAYTLVLTGGMLPDGDGDIDNDFSTSGVTPANPEQVLAGGIAPHDILIDGGTWFQQGIVQNNLATFQINQVAYSDAGTPFNGRGFEQVYDGGWQISSEDPINITIIEERRDVIPEPVTAGLGSLAMGALALYGTRRRRA